MSRSLIRASLVTTSLIMVVSGVIFGIYSRFIHPYRPRVNEIVLKLPQAHAGLDGLTMAFVTDTHVGPHFTADDLAPTIQILRSAKPDILLFGGDYISESPRFLEYVEEPLAAMVRTARIGAWGIYGNHDLANVRKRILAAIEPTGIRLLDNEAIEIETGRGSIWLIGIDDFLLGRPDIESAFSRVPANALRIAMWHEGDEAEQVQPYEPFLLLSGHSHGGQVRLPFLGPVAAPKMGQKYTSGRYDIGRMILFVSNGIGMYRPPVRFNCPPEVVLIRLVA